MAQRAVRPSRLFILGSPLTPGICFSSPHPPMSCPFAHCAVRLRVSSPGYALAWREQGRGWVRRRVWQTASQGLSSVSRRAL